MNRTVRIGLKVRRAAVLAACAVLLFGTPASAATGSPANTSLPVITGSPYVGQTLAVSTGTWTGITPMTFTYQWKRCNSSGGSCSKIAGSTAATRLLVAADNGKRLKVAVTARNSAGSKTATTAATAVVTTPAAPAIVTAPAISGTARSGETLTASDGTWSGTTPMTFATAWLRCPEVDPCAQIATGSSYVATDDDVDNSLAVQVTATNFVGSTLATSVPTADVLAALPANVDLPSVQGTAAGGETLTASPGSWTGTPTITFAYEWQRCDTLGENCASLATGDTYVTVAADLDHTLVVVVTATNAGGDAAATSPPSAVIQPTGAPPQNIDLPTLTGFAVDGETLTGAPGTWTGSDPVGLAYQWLGCTEPDLVCTAVPDATTDTYLIRSADVGQHLVFQVTGSDIGGTTTAASAPTDVVVGVAPASSSPPVVTGAPVDGSVLAATPGDWTGTTPMTFDYEWQRCDGTTCVAVGTDPTYTLSPDDFGFVLQVAATATNASGTAGPVTSEPTGTVTAAAPENITAPSISGTATEGSTLTALVGTWTGTVPVTFTYQWQRCAGATCTDATAAGLTDPGYVVVLEDVGDTLLVIVTASNIAGDVSVPSQPTDPVGGTSPSPTSTPVVSGTPEVGETLSTSNGTWTGVQPMSYTYAWQVCDEGGNACNPTMPPVTDPEYLVKTYDAGLTIAVEVTAHNAASEASAVSSPTGQVAAASTAITVANWHMEQTNGTMTDSSGYRNHGSLVNVVSGIPGSVGLGFRFNADPARVDVPTAPSLSPGSAKWTITVRVRFADPPSLEVGDYDLIRKGLGSTVGGDWKFEIWTNGKASCYAQGSTGGMRLTAGPDLSDNQWHTITCVETPTTLKLIVDGNSVGSKTGSIGAISNTDVLTVGAKIVGGDQYVGDLDEVLLKVG